MFSASIRPYASGSPRAPGRSHARRWRGSRFGAETRTLVARQHEPALLLWSQVAWASHWNLNGLNQDIFRGNGQPIFHQALEVEPNRFANIRDSFFDSLALRVASRQSRAKNVIAAFLFFLENYGVRMRHREPPLHIF